MPEDEMLAKKVWAVVGASENIDRYGYKIYKKLKSHGYTVFPINPNYKDIDGDRCYPNISSLPKCPDVIDMVVSPKHGIRIIEEAASLGIKNVWLQPGTVNADLLAIAEYRGMNVVQACVLVALR